MGPWNCNGYLSRMPQSSSSVASSQLRSVNIPLMSPFGECIITLLVNNFPTVQFRFNGHFYLSRIPQSSSSVASSQSRLRSQRDSRGTQLPDLHVNSVWLIFLFSRFLYLVWNGCCGFLGGNYFCQTFLQAAAVMSMLNRKKSRGTFAQTIFDSILF